MPAIKKGAGFTVGHDFARAWADIPITLAPEEYANPHHVIGYIPGNPDSSLGFLRREKIRVHVRAQDVIED